MVEEGVVWGKRVSIDVCGENGDEFVEYVYPKIFVFLFVDPGHSADGKWWL